MLAQLVEKAFEYKWWAAGALAVVGVYVVVCLTVLASHLPDDPSVVPVPAPKVSVSDSPVAGLPAAATPEAPSMEDAGDDEVASGADLRRADEAAWRFAQAYVDPSGEDGAWLRSVQAYSTPGFASSLETVDRADIPDARVTSHAVETPGDQACRITIRLSNGDEWTVTVVRDVRSWRVAAVVPADGS